MNQDEMYAYFGKAVATQRALKKYMDEMNEVLMTYADDTEFRECADATRMRTKMYSILHAMRIDIEWLLDEGNDD